MSISSCPCGDTRASLRELPFNQFKVKCPTCGFSSGVETGRRQAIAAWNRATMGKVVVLPTIAEVVTVCD